jgi:hypothetical protein
VSEPKRAHSIQLRVCPGCGALQLQFEDSQGRVFAFGALSPKAATILAVAMLDEVEDAAEIERAAKPACGDGRPACH